MFRQIQEQGNQTENEEKKKRIDAILRYLGNYTEKLMLQMKGNIRGVPQDRHMPECLQNFFDGGVGFVLQKISLYYGNV